MTVSEPLPLKRADELSGVASFAADRARAEPAAERRRKQRGR
jgi:hypothetical protein